MLMLALLLVGAAVGRAADAPSKAAVAQGPRVFALKCSACHGKDAAGSPMMAKLFKVDPVKLNLISGDAPTRSDEELLTVIRGGKNKMPAFKGKLKPAQIEEALGYIRSLSKAPAQKPAAAK